MKTCSLVAAGLLLLVQFSPAQEKNGWVELFNGKDTSGWKLRSEKVTVTKYIDASGAELAGAKQMKVDQQEVAQDEKARGPLRTPPKSNSP